jgi:hypothetical protein
VQDFESTPAEISDALTGCRHDDALSPRTRRAAVVEIQARQLDAGGISVHVVQRQVPASQDIIDRFTTRTRSAWTPMIFALGALALEHATAAHGGASDLVALDAGGSAIQLTFCRL